MSDSKRIPEYTIVIYTGQGVAGPMERFAFYSSDFDSCSPVVLFNDKKHLGGLFHMPGNGGKPLIADSSIAVLRDLMDCVQPTHVWLFHPGTQRTRWNDELEKLVEATDVEALGAVLKAQLRGSSGETAFHVWGRAGNILVRLDTGAGIPNIAPAYADSLPGRTWNAHPSGDLKSGPPEGCLFVPGPFNPADWRSVV